MDTISLIGIIVIAILQLTYIFIQHIFYNKKINALKDSISVLEVQVKDKTLVISELQKYSAGFDTKVSDNTM